MQVIDLTHDFSTDMPVYPGSESPIIKNNAMVESDGYSEKKLIFTSHIGTHIDAPAHILEGKYTLDNFSIDKFYGPAEIIDVSECENSEIDLKYLINHESKFKKNDFILFYTGYDKFWGNPKYFENIPVLSIESAEWIAKHHLKGVGLDISSVDPVGSTTLPVHKILLGAQFVIIENLRNLSALKNKKFIFSCFPLKIKDADGSPVRAVGLIDT